MASGVNGLVMKRDAPAASARARELSSPRVVTTRMGRAAQLVLTADELDHLDAADVRHVQIEDHQVEGLEREPLDGLQPAGGLGEGQAVARRAGRR